MTRKCAVFNVPSVNEMFWQFRLIYYKIFPTNRKKKVTAAKIHMDKMSIFRNMAIQTFSLSPHLLYIKLAACKVFIKTPLAKK